ncbi:Crossover junction endonuclease MUS81 [Linum grandiflorum]
MLTQEGEDVAKECLARSRMPDPVETFAGAEDSSNMDINYIADDESDQLQPTPPEVTVRSEDLSGQERSLDVPPQSLERFLHMGYSKEQVFDAFIEVSKTSGDKDISALWPAVLCHLREEQIYGLRSETQTSQNDCQLESTTVFPHGQVRPCGSQSSQMGTTWDHTNRLNACPTTSSINLRGCSPNLSNLDVPRPNMSVLRMPPLGVGERFEDAYEVLLVLDDREQFAIHGSRGRKLIDGISKEQRIKVEVKRLPVGDAIWVARHKYHFDEYVLDFVVERKNVSDLLSSIRGNRYRDQKLRLQRCGLKKLIYLVEGDTNTCEGAESIKTACFTTEILEGFDIQRSTSLPDTVKKYGHLTKSISEYYKSKSRSDEANQLGSCPSYGDFVKRCEELEKVTISDVFAMQLMQVPQVTEEVAMAVVDMHPTLVSLARAYSLLEGNLKAQEEMLEKTSNNIVNGAASKHIFQLVWGQ